MPAREVMTTSPSSNLGKLPRIVAGLGELNAVSSEVMFATGAAGGAIARVWYGGVVVCCVVVLFWKTEGVRFQCF